MLLIGIDTSGRNGSVAVCRAERNSFELGQQMLEGGTYSALLIPALNALLDRQKISNEEIDAFVVVSGPGSFTGLRVGIATVKGLCEVLQKPLVAVSMLEALAVLRGPGEEKVAVAMDAGRGEIYVGEFDLSGERAALVGESITKLASFADVAAAEGPLVLTPDSKVADALFAAKANVEIVDPVHAGELGRLGYMKLLAGEVSDPATLDANYIRRSDAELFSSPKR